ncbi:bifunctional phosphopantothenoylcysteine decarboxylase/phosphopantothenate--cysteine ligase CoaBC [Aestuariimicrobium soli]|uniref:bifunctional phosphopantothenoylcysteine decarboxylase/phosphopantothenate--cysteine ligase CoaBC n=1 Tax=Aestuariimicrobium soli TaxID=2035834 RepID=UPI003EBCE9B3
MNILLGVCGGIAAYKVVSLARLFVEGGHEVHVAPTDDSLKFVGLSTWEAISRNPVTTSVHDDVAQVRHVALGQQADMVVVAPATANTLARMAAGLADDLLGTTLLATRAPVLVAPAMHTEMWQHPATQHNVETLRDRGVHVVGPESGRLTGSDSGPGRMSEPEEIFRRALELVGEPVADENGRGDLAGVKVVVSAGGTREPLDPVRYLGNRSSGRQGVAVAAEAARRGAEVTLVAANIEAAVLDGASGVTVVPVGSAAELDAAMREVSDASDVLVMCAAVADYRPADIGQGKLRKEDVGTPELTLSLIENPDILRGLVERRASDQGSAAQVIVGFAAETADSEEQLLDLGRRKLERKGCDLLAVNAVGWHQGFESSDNAMVILGSGGTVVGRASGTKQQTAAALVDAIVQLRAAADPA